MASPKWSLAASALFLSTAAPAGAVTIVLSADLLGANEVPARDTPGTGRATVTFDDVTNILGVQADFSGLLGTTTMAHIHCCVPATANGPVATTVPSFAGFPLGVTSGTYSQSLDLTLATSFNPGFVTANGGNLTAARAAFVTGLLNGQTYFNIHTTLYPGGEIRGQLAQAVPEPATWATMLVGFGVIGFAARRRRAKVRVSYAA